MSRWAATRNITRPRFTCALAHAPVAAVVIALLLTWHHADPARFALMMTFAVLAIRQRTRWIVVLFLPDREHRDATGQPGD